MEILIYNYEGELLKYINRCFNNIKLATYASDEDLLLALSDIKHFPSFYYSREDAEWTNNKIISILDGRSIIKFCAFEQVYKGTLVVEDQKEAQRIANVLRFYWEENPKVSVNWPSKEQSLDVQLRLLYIKIKEVRRPNDKKGACRIVEFSWKSQLFQNPIKELGTSLVEKINIHLTDEGDFIIQDDQGNEVTVND